MNKVKSFVLSVVCAVVMCYLGTYLMGYALAIQIAHAYFAFFSDYVWLQFVLLSIFYQLLSYTFVAALAGYIIGRYTPKNWFSSVILCYLLFLVLMVVGLSVPFNRVFGYGNIDELIPLSLIPLALTLCAYWGYKRYMIIDGFRVVDAEL